MRGVLAALVAAGVLVPSAAALPPAPPLGTTPVWSESTTVVPSVMLATAKRYATTAESLNHDCAQVTDLLASLRHVRLSGEVPSRVLSITKLLLTYSDTILGVDSSCQLATKLGAAASSLQVASGSVFPNCVPPGELLTPCSWTFAMESRMDKRVRRFAPDICYWTLASGPPDPLNFAGRTVRFLATEGGC